MPSGASDSPSFTAFTGSRGSSLERAQFSPSSSGGAEKNRGGLTQGLERAQWVFCDPPAEMIWNFFEISVVGRMARILRATPLQYFYAKRRGD